MDKFFYPKSILVVGLSSRPNNMSRMILENLLRWGYEGKIFGLNPRTQDLHVDGVKMYRNLEDLPQVPDLAVCLIPARLIPEQVELCGRFGIKRMAIPSGGFGEFDDEGSKRGEKALKYARKYGVRFVGPNGLTVANTTSGLCLSFVPAYRPPVGHISIVSQSGGLGLTMWNILGDENLGMAKFASIGNKVDLDEVAFLEYFGSDPETKVIFLYLETITRGKELAEAARKIEKPVIVFKSNTTSAGKRAAMSHTASLSNDEDIINAAFEKAGVIRIHDFRDFFSVAKAFKLPPMKGNRIMVMSPAGGFSVITADLCERAGFAFADMGEDFYQGLKKYANAGVINFSNPLDMGDIYDPQLTAYVFFSVLHHADVDGAVYVSQWPHMPPGDDMFYRMFRTDLSKETWGAILSSGKPVGICLFGASDTMGQVKRQVNFPIFDSPEEMVRVLALQRNFYRKKAEAAEISSRPEGIDRIRAKAWVETHPGIIGEETQELLAHYGVAVVESLCAPSEAEARQGAETLGYPVAMKVVSPDAVHKSEAKGVLLNLRTATEVEKAFEEIRKNLLAYKPGADFRGVCLQPMAPSGSDMFIGGKHDESFGPVIFFGLGGMYVEVFRDLELALCPTTSGEVRAKLQRLLSYQILRGVRGQGSADLEGYVAAIVRVSHLMADFPEIRELDINPLRVATDGLGVVALDSRVRIAAMSEKGVSSRAG